jgi:hypothetical protein
MGRIPVIVPRPEIQQIEIADGTLEYEASLIRYLSSHSERGLFDIGTMLDIRQFGNISKTERFVILALERRLTFSRKLDFPGLAELGVLIPVKDFNEELAWATISQRVSVTSSFTVLDLCHCGMALNNPDYLKQIIESNQRGCAEADADALLIRFQKFKPRRREEVSRALNKLIRLGILRELIDLGNYRYRAVFNPYLVASTNSGIRQGILKAEDVLRIDGNEVAYSLPISTARQPAESNGAKVTGRRQYIKRNAYQSMYDAESVKRIATENRLIKALKRNAEYEKNGCLTSNQLTTIRMVMGEPTVPDLLRQSLRRTFAFAHTDPPTEIPTTAVIKKEKQK